MSCDIHANKHKQAHSCLRMRVYKHTSPGKHINTHACAISLLQKAIPERSICAIPKRTIRATPKRPTALLEQSHVDLGLIWVSLRMKFASYVVYPTKNVLKKTSGMSSQSKNKRNTECHKASPSSFLGQGWRGGEPARKDTCSTAPPQRFEK